MFPMVSILKLERMCIASEGSTMRLVVTSTNDDSKYRNKLPSVRAAVICIAHELYLVYILHSQAQEGKSLADVHFVASKKIVNQ